MRKVVAIIDNGLGPDDFAMHFVTIDADKIKQLQLLIDISHNNNATVIGVADRVKWEVPAPAILIEDYLKPHDFRDVTEYEWHTLDKRFRRWILARWARSSTVVRDDLWRLKSMK